MEIKKILDLKNDEIKRYLEKGQPLDFILEMLSKDENLVKYKNWVEEAKILMNPNPVQEEEISGMTEILQPILNYAEKKRFIDHLKYNRHKKIFYHEVAK